eukprot:CAMPEP_0170494532 /NCGR_PEP_ID=MMETSP0208-20121228/14694_1 /TAXON_ID=197538 /ORGANISM="Strombidium inclinatum, Strain S3" /LENGTH=44 /DNA_ID= /DNA_START= /DNA_END= /DNA_ORIENTATION=
MAKRPTAFVIKIEKPPPDQKDRKQVMGFVGDNGGKGKKATESSP